MRYTIEVKKLESISPSLIMGIVAGIITYLSYIVAISKDKERLLKEFSKLYDLSLKLKSLFEELVEDLYELWDDYSTDPKFVDKIEKELKINFDNAFEEVEKDYRLKLDMPKEKDIINHIKLMPVLSLPIIHTWIIEEAILKKPYFKWYANILYMENKIEKYLYWLDVSETILNFKIKSIDYYKEELKQFENFVKNLPSFSFLETMINEVKKFTINPLIENVKKFEKEFNNILKKTGKKFEDVGKILIGVGIGLLILFLILKFLKKK